jgi:hypothetical protein
MGNFDTAETDAVMNSIFDESKDQEEKVKEFIEGMNVDELEGIIRQIEKLKAKKVKEQKDHEPGK